MNAESLRLLLAGTLVAMFLLAAISQRRPPLLFSQFILRGMYAMLVSVPGPILVIPLQPGKSVQRKINKIYGGEV